MSSEQKVNTFPYTGTVSIVIVIPSLIKDVNNNYGGIVGFVRYLNQCVVTNFTKHLSGKCGRNVTKFFLQIHVSF